MNTFSEVALKALGMFPISVNATQELLESALCAEQITSQDYMWLCGRFNSGNLDAIRRIIQHGHSEYFEDVRTINLREEGERGSIYFDNDGRQYGTHYTLHVGDEAETQISLFFPDN